MRRMADRRCVLQVTCMDCLEVMKDAVYCQRCSH
eukprot:COSAG04_NODE_21136_length_379_cov_0.921429_2_plen_33_part_01